MNKIRSSVSVIIITINRPISLLQTINSLLQNTILPREIIVVDSANSKRTAEKVRRYCEQYRCAHLIRYIGIPNKGKSFAINYGIRSSSGAFIARIDDDERADRDWIKSILRTFRDNPKAAAVTGPVIPSSLGNYWHRVWNEIVKDSYGKIGKASFIFGNNAAFKRGIFSRLNLYYDERMQYVTGEDTYVAYALEMNGQTIIQDYRMKVFHDYRVSLKDFFSQWFQYGEGDYYLWVLHPDILRWLHGEKETKLTLILLIRGTLKNLSHWRVSPSCASLWFGLVVKEVAYFIGVMSGYIRVAIDYKGIEPSR